MPAQADQLKIVVLGSGTSAGVPTPGCSCPVCTSADPRDNRLRPSVLLQYAGRNVLIDTTPDFRQQALRAGISHLDAILFTHWHADHVMGLDDVRPFNFRRPEPIPMFGDERTIETIQSAFRYAFEPKPSRPNTYVPRLAPRKLDGRPFELFGLEIHPVRLLHGPDEILGFRFGSAAYLTDHSDIPEESCRLLEDLDVLFLDALRHRPHPTHSTVARSLEHVARLRPKRAYFTHICHDLGHEETENSLPEHVHLAYDGLEIETTAAVRRPEQAKVESETGFRVFQSVGEAAADFGPAAISIGNFDGVHIGHRALFHRLARLSREHGWKASVVTFDPHPLQIVAPARAPRLLCTTEERLAAMRECGIGQVVVIPFSKEFSRLAPEAFVEGVLVRLGARAVLVGENFCFGHQHAGDARLLARLGETHGFETHIVQGVRWRRRVVSSSEIRRAIQQGHVDVAARLLGRPYTLEGDVVPGAGLGSRQTVPTLNMRTPAEVLPAHGVYVTRVSALDSDRSWAAVTNAGVRPTFGGGDFVIESFLLDPFDGASPDRIRIELLRRLRSERQFPDAEALKAQILSDAARARAFHRRVGRWVKEPAA